MEKPFITIVIPTFNHAKFLRNAIYSVANQTYTNWEIVIVDNHSTDNTDDVLKEFVNLPLRAFKIKNYGIIASSRNFGIQKAKGEWISFLDSDDEWLPDKLQKCVEKINNDVDIIFHNLTIRRKKRKFYNKRLIQGRHLNKPILVDLLINGNPIVNSTVVVRRDLLIKLNGLNEDPQMIAAEDYNTWLRLAQITEGFVYVPESIGFYTVHDSGMSRKDMSIPMWYATKDFLRWLNRKEFKMYKSNLVYAKARFSYTNKNDFLIDKRLKFCIKYGNYEIKLKAIYMLSQLSWNRLSNFLRG